MWPLGAAGLNADLLSFLLGEKTKQKKTNKTSSNNTIWLNDQIRLTWHHTMGV